MLRKALVVGLLLPILSLSVKVTAQVQQNVTKIRLSEALAMAQQHNKNLLVQELHTQNAKIRIKQQQQARQPDVVYHTNFHVLSNIGQYEEGILHKATSYEVPRLKYNFTLDASMPIYQGGSINAAVALAKFGSEVANLPQQSKVKDVNFQLTTLFLQALHLEEQQALLLKKMSEDSVVIHHIQQLKNNEAVTHNDVLRAQLQLSKHRIAYSDLGSELAILAHEVQTILSLPSTDTLLLVTEDLLHEHQQKETTEELVQFAFRNNYNYLISQKDITKAQLNWKLSRAAALPKISMTSNYGWNYPNFMFFPPEAHLYRFGMVGFNFQMPITQGYKNKRQMMQAKNAITIAQLAAEEEEEQLHHKVFAAQERWLEADKKILIATEAIQQAKENYRIVKLKYQNQLSLITELMDADNTLLEAESYLISLQINKELKYYHIQYTIGKL